MPVCPTLVQTEARVMKSPQDLSVSVHRVGRDPPVLKTWMNAPPVRVHKVERVSTYPMASSASVLLSGSGKLVKSMQMSVWGSLV